GAFGRCYSVEDKNGQMHACKVLDKQNFKNPQYHKRLINEIEVMRKIPPHPHIVNFVQCFEDSAFVYIVMELCNSKGLDTVFKNRRRLSEPEVRYFMFQLADAVEHMHRHRVIHRDLKFANILLTNSMQVKVADFGLSAMLISDKERKKSFLGTPNFLAPEVVNRPRDGHSYEVDTWALGIVMYSMLYSKPPFHVSGGGGKHVQSKALYHKITTEEVRFPTSPHVSHEARCMMTLLLEKNPDRRPNASQIKRLDFFTRYHIMPHLPGSVYRQAPDIGEKYTTIKPDSTLPSRSARLPSDRDHRSDLAPPMSPAPMTASRSAPQPYSATTQAHDLAGQLQQINLDSGRAGPVPTSKPNSRSSNDNPVSAPRSGAPLRPSDLARLDIPKSLPREPAVASPQVQISPNGLPASPSISPNTYSPDRVAFPGHPGSSRPGMSPPAVNRPPPPHPSVQIATRMHAFDPELNSPGVPTPVSANPPPVPMQRPDPRLAAAPEAGAGRTTEPPRPSPVDLTRHRKCPIMSSMEGRIVQFFSQVAKAKKSSDGVMGQAVNPDSLRPKVFMSKWIDLSSKYGLGYELTNNSYGVHFNDNTTLLLLPNQQQVEHLFYDPAKAQKSIKRQTHTLDNYPDDLKKKVTLLLQFRRYMRKQLHNTVPANITTLHRQNEAYWYNSNHSAESHADSDRTLCICHAFDQKGAGIPGPTATDPHLANQPDGSQPHSQTQVTHGSHCPLAWTNRDPAHSLLYLNKFIRTKYAAVFRISHGVLQLNFTHDHTKLIIQSRGEVITYISDGTAKTYALSDVQSLMHHTEILKRLKYTRDVLSLINLRRNPADPAK
ncbi:Cell cycle serine/threonine-protein kinase cdc5/MSD2, partial [Dimargaris verticillata]